ncbi:MAG: DUF4097 domain-containing protein [Coriobacteriia bacterium]|nr:DUF4097 domain-containing protein [Coriobacteriia bacterium]
MSKAIRNLLILAGVLVIVGAIIAGAGFALGGMRSINLTREGPIVIGADSRDMMVVDEKYSKITALDVSMDLGEFELVEGDSFSLTGRYTSGIQQFEVTEKNGVLTIRLKQISRIGIGYIGVNGFHDQLTFTYPKGTKFTSVEVSLSLGSLSARNLEAETLRVTLDLGEFSGNTITAESMYAQLNLGGCTINGLTITKDGSFKLDSGSLSLRNATANNLVMKNNLGGVDYSGTLTGTCRADLDLGSLSLKLDNKEGEVDYHAKADLGSIKVNGREQGSSVSRGVTSPRCTLEITLSLGSAELSFK